MARHGSITRNKLKPEEQFTGVDDMKLQLTLASLSDKYSDQIRDFVYRCYQDDQLASWYRAIRSAGTYQKGGKTKVYRKVVEFPNAYVYDFCDTVLTSLYGRDWTDNYKALRHDIVKPWHVVSNL